MSSAAGAHPEFSEHVRLLERKKAEKVRVAEVWRTYQLDIVEAFYQSDRQGAEDDFVVRGLPVRRTRAGAMLPCSARGD